MNKTILVISISGILLIAIAASTAALALPQGKPFQELENKITNSQIVPIGTVLNWWCSADCTIPDGYVLADGSVVNDPESPFNGQSLPDLRDKFVRGANNIANIGTITGNSLHSHTGNTNTITHNHGSITAADVHDHLIDIESIGLHEHSSFIGAVDGEGNHFHETELIDVESETSDAIGETIFVNRDPDGLFQVPLVTHEHMYDLGHGHTPGATSGGDGEHGHDVNTFPDGLHAPMATADVNTHDHQIEIQQNSHSHTTTSNSEFNLPENVGLLKIIRIK